MSSCFDFYVRLGFEANPSAREREEARGAGFGGICLGRMGEKKSRRLRKNQKKMILHLSAALIKNPHNNAGVISVWGNFSYGFFQTPIEYSYCNIHNNSNRDICVSLYYPDDIDTYIPHNVRIESLVFAPWLLFF